MRVADVTSFPSHFWKNTKIKISPGNFLFHPPFANREFFFVSALFSAFVFKHPIVRFEIFEDKRGINHLKVGCEYEIRIPSPLASHPPYRSAMTQMVALCLSYCSLPLLLVVVGGCTSPFNISNTYRSRLGGWESVLMASCENGASPTLSYALYNSHIYIISIPRRFWLYNLMWILPASRKGL